MSETENRQPNNIKNNPKIMKAWAVYDWANSVYSWLLLPLFFPFITLFLPLRMRKRICDGNQKWIDVPVRHAIKIFGNEYQPDAVYGYSLTISFFIVVLLSPFLSSLADTIGNKNHSCSFSVILGQHPVWD